MIGIHSLRKTFKTGTDSVQAVDGVDLQVNEKEFFVLLGLSGSGKTTLLRCVAGLERPEAGEIFLGSRWSAPQNGIFSSLRRIGRSAWCFSPMQCGPI